MNHHGAVSRLPRAGFPRSEVLVRWRTPQALNSPGTAQPVDFLWSSDALTHEESPTSQLCPLSPEIPWARCSFQVYALLRPAALKAIGGITPYPTPRLYLRLSLRPTATLCQREFDSRKLRRSPLWLGRTHFPILAPLDLATGLPFKPSAPSALAAAGVLG